MWTYPAGLLNVSEMLIFWSIYALSLTRSTDNLVAIGQRDLGKGVKKCIGFLAQRTLFSLCI